jgi:hypothetical protein
VKLYNCQDVHIKCLVRIFNNCKYVFRWRESMHPEAGLNFCKVEGVCAPEAGLNFLNE